MRAAVLYGREDVRVEDVPNQPLRRGEVRVHIHAALTCGTDLKVFKRGYHAKMIVPPAVFGHEFSGIISETGPEVQDWKVGDRVVAANSAPCGECFFCQNQQENLCDHLLFLNGAYAESIVIPQRIVEKNLLRLEPATRLEDAALVEPFACVVHGVQELQLRGDEHVLVVGAGPIGLMFVALLRHLGCDVWAAGRGQDRLATAHRLGARTIAVSDGDVIAAVRARGLPPFDVVIEAVGKPEVWEAAVQLVRKGGKVNFFGGCPAGTSVRLDTGLLHYSSIVLLASFHHTPRAVRRSLELVQAGVISGKDFVTRACKLHELPAVLSQMAQGNHAVKTLVDVNG